MFTLPKPKLAVLCLCLILAGCNAKNETAANSPPRGGTTDPQELTQSAVEKQAIGAYEEAIGLLQQALDINPRFVPAYYRMGLVYEEWDQRQEAIKAYEKVLEIEPANTSARLGLGALYSKLNRNDLAIKEYLEVAKATPDDPELHFKIALEYWYIQQLPKSAEHYRKVIEIHPGHMQGHLNLASVYQRMKEWDKALEEIEIALHLGRESNDEQAISIAENKLAFITGRMNMTAKDFKRKTQPPFE